MDENSPTTSSIPKLNYLNLLQELDKLSNIIYESNKRCDDADIDTIFNNLANNIEDVSGRMVERKRAMFLITIINTLLRICTIYKFDDILSRTSFQSLLSKVKHLISNLPEETYSQYGHDIRDSMFMNLSKDDLAEKCFDRCHSDKTSPITDVTTTADKSSQGNIFSFNQFVQWYMYFPNWFLTSEFSLKVDEFKKKYTSLMATFLKFLDNFLISTNGHVSEMRLEVVVSFLTISCNLTDRVPLVPIFVELGYIEKTVSWIDTDIFKCYISKLGKPIFSIVHNLSRDKMSLSRFRKLNAFNVLMEGKTLVDNQNDEILREYFGITLIALSTNDEPPEESKILILETTRTLYERCNKIGKARRLTYGGFHLSEVLALLHRAFSNTYVIKDIFDNATNEKPTPIEYFPELLLSIYGVLLDREPIELEKCAAECLLKILLQIASYPEYQEELSKNNELCVVIEGLANRSKEDVAKRIAYNLQLSPLSQESEKEKSPMIYISYDTADQEFCERFVDELRKQTKIPIEVDYENRYLCDDMWEYSSKMIKFATVIVILISTAYGESIDKFQELSYIVSTNKLRKKKTDLLVVEAEKDFESKRSWMKELLSGMIPITYTEDMTNIVSQVCDQIHVSKKSSNKWIPCKSRSEQKKAITSAPIPVNDINLPLINTHLRNDSTTISIPSNINCISDSSVLTATKKQRPFSIVSNQVTHSGSIDSSTLV